MQLLSDTDGKGALAFLFAPGADRCQGSTGSGSTGETPGADDKKSDDDKKSEDDKTAEDDKKSEEEKPADTTQEEVKAGSFRDVTSTHWAFASVERRRNWALSPAIPTAPSDPTPP